MDLLRVSGVSKGIEKDWVVNAVSFTQLKGQNIAIAGETGSGKSTLLKIIAGLVQPDGGEVTLENERVKGPEERLLPGHPKIAYLSQDFELRHHYRVEEVLAYANQLPESEAEAIYEVCRIKHLVKRKTDQLSGGEKQRIAFARLLITAPKLLLLDEPFSNLDIAHKRILKSVIHDIGHKLNISCILVSHDPLDTLSWADQIIVMKDGQLVQKGSSREIYDRPLNEYIAGLFGSYNLLPAEAIKYFCHFNSTLPSGKSAFIRPERFELKEEDADVQRGIVNAVRYFGSYHEVDVSLNGIVITVRTALEKPDIGSAVFVSVSSDSFWYI